MITNKEWLDMIEMLLATNSFSQRDDILWDFISKHDIATEATSLMSVVKAGKKEQAAWGASRRNEAEKVKEAKRRNAPSSFDDPKYKLKLNGYKCSCCGDVLKKGWMWKIAENTFLNFCDKPECFPEDRKEFMLKDKTYLKFKDKMVFTIVGAN